MTRLRLGHGGPVAVTGDRRLEGRCQVGQHIRDGPVGAPQGVQVSLLLCVQHRQVGQRRVGVGPTHRLQQVGHLVQDAGRHLVRQPGGVMLQRQPQRTFVMDRQRHQRRALLDQADAGPAAAVRRKPRGKRAALIHQDGIVKRRTALPTGPLPDQRLSRMGMRPQLQRLRPQARQQVAEGSDVVHPHLERHRRDQTARDPVVAATTRFHQTEGRAGPPGPAHQQHRPSRLHHRQRGHLRRMGQTADGVARVHRQGQVGLVHRAMRFRRNRGKGRRDGFIGQRGGKGGTGLRLVRWRSRIAWTKPMPGAISGSPDRIRHSSVRINAMLVPSIRRGGWSTPSGPAPHPDRPL